MKTVTLTRLATGPDPDGAAQRTDVDETQLDVSHVRSWALTVREVAMGPKFSPLKVSVAPLATGMLLGRR